MILAEKIIKLRKEQGWSQEDLAMRLDVTRQSVSKWESMASLPDLDKIIKMSELFGVSTDFLLKDESPPEVACINADSTPGDKARIITVEEANQYLSTARSAASKIASGVSLCILSPVILILLSVASGEGKIPLSEGAAASIGICLLLLLVAAAVALFVSNGMRLSPYEYLEKEPIHTEYGVAGIAETLREEYAPTYRRLLIVGITLCIVSVLPLMAAIITENPFLIGCAVAVILLIVAIGVNLIIRAGSIWDSYQKLLEEGDFTREKKSENKRNEPFIIFYWCFVLAIYLGLSFLTGRWDSTWIVWPVTAVFFGAALALKKMLQKN